MENEECDMSVNELINALNESKRQNDELRQSVEALTTANSDLVKSLSKVDETTTTAEKAAMDMLSEALDNLIGGYDNGK